MSQETVGEPSLQPNLATESGSTLLRHILDEVRSRVEPVDTDYNERYIDKGPSWGEHINYRDGGQHGQTHRNKI